MSSVATVLADPSVHVLATTTLDTDNAGSGFQGFNIHFGKDLVNIARVVGGVIAIAWLFFAVFKFSSPSSRAGGGSMLQKIGGAGPLIAALVSIAVLLDINVSMKLINGALKAGWGLLNLVVSGL